MIRICEKINNEEQLKKIRSSVKLGGGMSMETWLKGVKSVTTNVTSPALFNLFGCWEPCILSARLHPLEQNVIILTLTTKSGAMLQKEVPWEMKRRYKARSGGRPRKT